MVKKIIMITGLLAFCVAICWNVIVHDKVDTNPAQEIPLEDQKKRSELLQLLEEARPGCRILWVKALHSWKKTAGI